ncbi:hypothetical protein RJ55_00065 [Drechmeria coniospora]|nr:hypothetical protein RJ55_00065 [Drechmeria coniospora]
MQMSTPSQPRPLGSDQSPHALADNVDDDDSIFEDPDGALAALQPAMSYAASSLASSQTPTTERTAALETGGLLDAIAEVDGDGDGDGGGILEHGPSISFAAGTMETKLSGRPDPGQPLGSHDPNRIGKPSLGSPRKPGSNEATNEEDSRSAPSRSDLEESALGPTRQSRSRSAGQEVFKKLSKAFPSINLPTQFRPTSFLASFNGDHKHGENGSFRSAPAGAPFSASTIRHGIDSRTFPLRRTRTPPPTQARPPVLRRVTSDESILYHSLSRASSLGDDDRFHDVRAMVNIRFMAFKDSLPDVPNFKLPGLPRLQVASRMPSISLNGLFSNSTDDAVTSRHAMADRGMPGTVTSPTMPKNATSTALDRVLEELTGDIVVLGGYRGSILRSAEPPYQQLWAPVKLGFNMRKANLEVGLEDEDEESMEERIMPSGMLQHIGPIDISRKLFKRLRSCENARNGKLRVWDFGYDWRLSPAASSHRLQQFLANLPSNQAGAEPRSRGAIVIAHSLGGLITRHAVNRQPLLFAGVLYAGVPQRCVNILGPLRNGDAVLFNEKLLTAHVNFSIRTSFALLPDDGFCFVDRDTGEQYPVDFYKAEDWVKWRLSPCVAPVLPPHNRDRQPMSSPLSSLFPNSLLKGNRSERNGSTGESGSNQERDPNLSIAGDVRNVATEPRLNSADAQSGASPHPQPPHLPLTEMTPDRDRDRDRDRHMAYLRRTLAATKKFRSELGHSSAIESSNTYPPHAVLYGKSIPTVYAAQVRGWDGIPCADAYDDLLFRAGDGVVLAKEAMLPPGYSLVRAGRVSTERGHLTMLGDLPAVGQALESLVRGRKKGIGLGTGATGGRVGDRT